VGVLLWGAGLRAEPPSTGASHPAAPLENWRTSPWHGVIDGAGRIIPCRCRYQGHEYRLGEVVCMQTHMGTVMTRCDLFMNNTSWIPTSQPCTTSQAPASMSIAARLSAD
jgi:hypothetical protein